MPKDLVRPEVSAAREKLAGLIAERADPDLIEEAREELAASYLSAEDLESIKANIAKAPRPTPEEAGHLHRILFSARELRISEMRGDMIEGSGCALSPRL